MASGALSQAEIVRLIADAPEGRPLPLVYLVDDEATPTMRITAFLLKHRGGGFMIAVPNTQVVHDLVSGFATEAGDNPLCFTELDVACETPRHRLVGDVSLLFADVPWSWLGFFRKGSALRASSLTLVSVVSGTSVVRPLVSAALAAADAWINSAIAEPDLQESMGEYATAVEVEGEAEDAEPEEEDDAAPNAELARLRAQVAALERAAQTQPPPAGGGLRGLGGWCSRPVPGGWWCQSFGRRPGPSSCCCWCGSPENRSARACASRVGGVPGRWFVGRAGCRGQSGRGSGDWCRSFASEAFGDPDTDVEPAHRDPSPGPPGDRSGIRRSQRRRQLECAWKRRQRRLCEAAEGQCSSCLTDPATCRRRCGGIDRGSPEQPHEALHREALPAGRASHSGSRRDLCRSSLASCAARIGQPGARSLDGSIDPLRGPGRDRERKDATCLVTHRPPGALLVDDDAQEIWPQALREELSLSLGVSKPSVFERNGLAVFSNELGCRQRPRQRSREGGRRCGRERTIGSSPSPASPPQRRAKLDNLRTRDRTACQAARVELERPPLNSIVSFDPAGAMPSAARAGPKGQCCHSASACSPPFPQTPALEPKRGVCKSLPEPPKLPQSETCFLSWVGSFLSSIWGARCGLGSFLRLSLCAPACTVVSEQRSGDLWPVPMPSRARWTAHASCTLGPQRRRRARVHKLAWDLVRLQVGCLNWLALGSPCVPPSGACVGGAPVSESQHAVVETLERHSLHFLRAGCFSSSFPRAQR